MSSASSDLGSPAGKSRAELNEIDASTKLPVLLFLVSGAVWLVVSSLLGLIASTQLVQPTFFADCEWFTHGRVKPMAQNAFVYGWAFNAAFAVIVWLMARLSRTVAASPVTTFVGGLFWNAGVSAGLIGIMIGDTTGYKLLEMPGYVAPLLFVAYGLIGGGVAITFGRGRSFTVYATQWYLLAAVFWFPWLYSIAQVTLVHSAPRGTAQAITAAWYSFSVYGLFLAPVALGAIYYLLPKRLGRSIAGYSLARFGFWSYAVLITFAGMGQLVGSPVPAWVQTVGVSANVFLLIPAFVFGLNFIVTMVKAPRGVAGGPALNFVRFGALMFLLSLLLGIYVSLPSVAKILQLTLAGDALDQLRFYGFVSMVLFGAIYFLVPRVVVDRWPSGALIFAHFWASALGILLVVGSLLIGGFVQGAAINDAVRFESFTAVVSATQPFVFASVLGLLLLLIGHLAYLVHVIQVTVSSLVTSKQDSAETLFPNPPALEVNR